MSSVIIKKENFTNDVFFSRFDFLIKHCREGQILDLGNVGGVYGKGVSNSSHAKLIEMFPNSTVHGFDLYEPENIADLPNQKSGDIEKGLPYEDGVFDTVYMGELLEHINNPGNVLQEVNRVLKDNGVFVLDVPNPYGFKRIMKFILQREENLGDPTHLIFYTPSSLMSMLRKNNFIVEELGTKISKKNGWIPRFFSKGLGAHLLVAVTKNKENIS